jgi:hypothetical protein
MAEGGEAPFASVFAVAGLTGRLCGAFLGLYGWILKRRGAAEWLLMDAVITSRSTGRQS